LLSGGTKGSPPGPGRPRDELRAWLRAVTWEKLPGIFERWDSLDHEQQVGLMERIALKYGLGTQNESVSKADVEQVAKLMVSKLREIAVARWGRTEEEAEQAYDEMCATVRELAGGG
jgi:phosphoribulokinase